ncbi:hypothetical protein CWS02_08140 [Enterobacter sp. EA-1]|nr:hypothetical protein CWS02_08140 [Enterobacter sp. EA-1]
MAKKPAGSAADDEWQRSGAELRAAVMAMEAERAGLPPLPELHTRNLRERMTAMLYLLGASGANLQTLQDTLPPEPAQEGEALSVPPHNETPEPPAHSGAEFQGAPPATSAAGNSQEYIELPMWGGGSLTELSGCPVAGGGDVELVCQSRQRCWHAGQQPRPALAVFCWLRRRRYPPEGRRKPSALPHCWQGCHMLVFDVWSQR